MTFKIYSADGEHLFDLHDEQNRELVSLRCCPHSLRMQSYLLKMRGSKRHPGYDVEGMGRAFVRNMESEGIVEGASTITQQLVTSTYMPDSKNIMTYEER
ncbi:MAG: transglycosylase domain-containing protein [Actinomycetota bacterium]|nr:transglycosylase domain-containing protein [Actinomycetota bacterium]